MERLSNSGAWKPGILSKLGAAWGGIWLEWKRANESGSEIVRVQPNITASKSKGGCELGLMWASMDVVKSAGWTLRRMPTLANGSTMASAALALPFFTLRTERGNTHGL